MLTKYGGIGTYLQYELSQPCCTWTSRLRDRGRREIGRNKPRYTLTTKLLDKSLDQIILRTCQDVLSEVIQSSRIVDYDYLARQTQSVLKQTVCIVIIIIAMHRLSACG